MYDRANEFLQGHIDTATTMDEMVGEVQGNRGFYQGLLVWRSRMRRRREVRHRRMATRCLIEDEEMFPISVSGVESR